MTIRAGELISHQEEGRIVHSRLGEIALKRNIKIRTFPDLFADVQIGQARIRLLHPTPDFLENESKVDLYALSPVIMRRPLRSVLPQSDQMTSWRDSAYDLRRPTPNVMTLTARIRAPIYIR